MKISSVRTARQSDGEGLFFLFLFGWIDFQAAGGPTRKVRSQRIPLCDVGALWE